jgi:DNA repair protein RecN (Recombination protein N)
MLTKLKIENVALVDSVELTFEPGLSVLTGETGAGKSVIVTALALALGERADREFVHHGTDSAIVCANFDISRPPHNSLRHPPSDGDVDLVEVRRELAADGISKAKIDGKQASLSQLRRIIAPMAEILGQHANQMLMNEDNHLAFLDRFASLEPLREEVAQVFSEWQKVSTELASIKGKREQLKRDRELLLFQKAEIEKAHLRIGEEEEYINERKILDSARTLMASAEMIQQTLDADDSSISNLLGLIRKELDRMATIDKSLQKQMETLSEIEFQVEEIRRFIQQYGSLIQDNPQRIEEINLRLDEIYNLKKKYGGSEEAVLKTLTEINEKLKERPDINGLINSLEKENDKLYKSYSEKAVALSEARMRAARRLRKMVINELNELAIDNCNFEFEFLYDDDDTGGILVNGRAVRPYAHGLEKGRFLFSANPGAPLKSLVKTASGGEISRVLLALKSAERQHSRLSRSLLVFDEVDAGIGGRTATEVGKKLKKLSEDCQIIVITHLHQIARAADHHYVAEKSTDRHNHTTIAVRKLDKDDIPQELDRMVALPERA